MKTYTGSRTIDGIKIEVDGEPLNERYDIQQFSKGGFEWAYTGDAPKQLALAILAEHLGDSDKALMLCERFMKLVISDLDNDWTLSEADINSTLSTLVPE